MRIFAASLATETNTFAPLPTDRRAFETAFYAPPGAHPPTPTLCSAPVIAAREAAAVFRALNGGQGGDGKAPKATPYGEQQKRVIDALGGDQ